MQDRVDVQIDEYEGELILLAGSISQCHSVVHELPPERLPSSATDGEIGEAVLAAARRCRGIVSDPPTMAEDCAKSLGFRSWAERQKKAVHVSVVRRNGWDYFKILPVRKGNKSGTTYLFTETAFKAPIGDARQIGAHVREALRLSAEWLSLPPLK